MTNNEVFKTLLHLTGLGVNEKLLIHICKLGGVDATPSLIKGWRTEIIDKRATSMPDHILRGFLQGMFKYRDEMSKKNIDIFYHLWKGKV